MKVLVTDHHLPGPQLPDAAVIVNPNQPDCGFESTSIAGVGVMFYVLLALRAELRTRGAFDAAAQPRLDALLDLVALGTVADVVKLDANNRRLVAQGLKRLRAGRMQPGLAALFSAAGRDPQRAAELARTLDGINRERREVESGMRDQAELMLDELMPRGEAPPALALFDPQFHEGVVGIVAGRVKDRLHRPTFVFARGADGLLKGSGRSIAGFHLRDALDLLSKRHPTVLKRFGGHAMAAGCSLAEADLPTFDAAFQAVAREWLEPALLQRRVSTDGPLPPQWFDIATVRLLEHEVWGQSFEPPVFVDDVQIVSQRLVGQRHLKLGVRHAGVLRDAIWFGRAEPVPVQVRMAYRLALDEYQGQQRLQMMVEAIE
jgi:single-stranded-DNA-specific exonuclease